MAFAICTYNVGISSADQVLDETGVKKMRAAECDVFLLQEAQPRVGEDFVRCPALLDAMGGMDCCTEGPYLGGLGAGVVLESGTGCATYPPSSLADQPRGVAAKYAARTTQKLIVRVANLRVALLNHHSRAGQGARGTATFYRAEAVRHLKSAAEEDVSQGRVDVAVIAGDFNVDPTVFGSIASDKWLCEHERGAPKTNGQFHWATCAVFSLLPVHACRRQDSKSYGTGNVSDAHSALNMRVSLYPPPTSPVIAAEKLWEKYVEPGSNRVWFYNTRDARSFFADSGAWEAFVDFEGKRWWWNAESVAEWFYD